VRRDKPAWRFRACDTTAEISLFDGERATLQRWARRHSSSQALALRSRIVLACADGTGTHAEIAARLGCNPVTMSKWRHRFAADISMGSWTPRARERPDHR
jgi:hypothetical protein